MRLIYSPGHFPGQQHIRHAFTGGHLGAIFQGTDRHHEPHQYAQESVSPDVGQVSNLSSPTAPRSVGEPRLAPTG